MTAKAALSQQTQPVDPTVALQTATKQYVDGFTFGPKLTVAQWEATRPTNYLIAHRGSGDLIPEHSLEAYDYAVKAGAQAMEVSVVLSADGVLVCNHDLTMTRTSNLTGAANTFLSNQLHAARLNKMLQCGQYWIDNPPKVVLFEEVLRRYGGRVVMCVEAKNDSAYPAMVAMIESYGLKSSTIIKAFWNSGRIATAKAAGYKTFVYFDNSSISAPNIAGVIANTDYLVVPTWTDVGEGFAYNTTNINTAIANAAGKPVWVYPCHRRYDVTVLSALGVQGFITANYEYHAKPTTQFLKASRWETQMIGAGENVVNPAEPTYAIGFATAGQASLKRQGGQAFLAMGTYCPTGASGYSIAFDIQWTTLPVDTAALLWMAWGRADDRYYERSLNTGLAGNQAYLRQTGNIGLNRHDTSGATVGTASEVATTAITTGTWVSLKLDVTATTATLTRTDGTPVSTVWTDSTNRGGYFHIGKTSTDGVAAIRNLVIT